MFPKTKGTVVEKNGALLGKYDVGLDFLDATPLAVVLWIGKGRPRDG